MPKYALYKDGKIVREYSRVPLSLSNISNFNNLSDQEKRAYHIYPILETKESFDPDTEVLEGPIDTFNGEEIIRRWAPRPMTDEELEVVDKRKLQEASRIQAHIVTSVISEMFGKMIAAGILDPQDMDPEVIREFAKLQALVKKPTRPGNPNG